MKYTITIICFLFSINAYAQKIEIRPIPISLENDTVRTNKSLDDFLDYYYSAKWDSLAVSTTNFLKIVRWTDSNFPAINENNYFHIILVDSEDIAEYLFHENKILVHKVLPGISEKNETLYQVVLSKQPINKINTLYTFEPKADPLLDLIPAFVSSGVTNVIGLIPEMTSIFMMETEDQELPFFESRFNIKLYNVPIPLKKATFKASTIYHENEKVKYSHETEFINNPKRLISFDVMTGYLFNFDNKYSYSLSDNVISKDLLKNLFTMPTINFHLKKYNPVLERESFREKARVFVGIGVLPKPMIGAGFGFEFYPGVSLNAGYSLLFVDDLKNGDEPEIAPSDDDDPFDKAIRSGAFFSLSFKFSK